MEDRYLLFSYQNYYPAGGFRDFKISSNNLNDFYEKITKDENNHGLSDTYEIYDIVENKILRVQYCYTAKEIIEAIKDEKFIELEKEMF